MKEISVFNRTYDTTQVTDILWKRNAGGIIFYEINGYGRDKLAAIQEIVEAYTTRISILTDYEKRTKDESVVADWPFIYPQTKVEVFAN